MSKNNNSNALITLLLGGIFAVLLYGREAVQSFISGTTSLALVIGIGLLILAALFYSGKYIGKILHPILLLVISGYTWLEAKIGSQATKLIAYVSVFSILIFLACLIDDFNYKNNVKSELNTKSINTYVKKRLAVRGTVYEDLTLSLIGAGIPQDAVATLQNVYSPVLSTIKNGDIFEVLFDQDSNAPTIIYAAFKISGKVIPVYRVAVQNGVFEYYDASGAPINTKNKSVPLTGRQLSNFQEWRNKVHTQFEVIKEQNN